MKNVARWRPALIGLLLLVLVALPLLNLSVPGVLPGATYTPGTLQLLATCLLVGSLAVTYNLLFAVTGLLSFGHALFFAVGCYVFALLLQHAHLSLLPAALLTLVISAVVALLVGLVSLRVSGISFAMVTLAFAQAGSVLVLNNFGGLTGGEDGLGLTDTKLPGWLLGVVNTRNLYWLALAVAVVVTGVVGWVVASHAGRLMLAVRESELRARVLGIRVYRVRLLSFTLAAVLASLAGMAYLLVVSGATPEITTSSFTLSLLVMIVIGGVGSRAGAMLGGVIYTLLDQRLSALAAAADPGSLPAVLRVPLAQPTFLLGLLFVVVVMLLPGGITGAFARLSGTRRRRPQRAGHTSSTEPASDGVR